MLRRKLLVPLMFAGMALPMLSSCYFNSAGHIVDAASHKARVYTEDISVGKTVFTDGNRYYIELPHYRYGKKITTQYNALDDETSSNNAERTYKGMQMFEIPADYALYITGKSSSPVTLTYVRPVENGPEIKRFNSLPVTRKPAEGTTDWEYKSPYAPLLYTACAFDWLIVDLPITLVENALMITGVTLALIAAASDESNNTTYTSDSSTGTTTGASYTAADYFQFYLKAIDADSKVNYLTKAAEMGHAEAQCHLGLFYILVSDEWRKDGNTSYEVACLNEGIHWLKMAARNGDILAQGRLSRMGYTW